MTAAQQTFTIGELSKRTGVPVKTIRFYSDQGVLPPAEVTDAGYRRYATPDVIRLETVRTLRAAGFDIATIRNVLNRDLDPHEAYRLQIEAISMQERTLRRQRGVLERMLAADETSGQADRSRALALLTSAERSAFLRNQFDAGMQDIQVDEAWWSGFLAAAIEGIPDDLDDVQLAAWIELVEMTSEPSFAEAINRTAQPFWNELLPGSAMDTEAWQHHQRAVVDRAREAVRAGIHPDSSAGQDIIQRWTQDLASVIDPHRVQQLLTHMVETHDPRLAHYWRLITTVKRMTWDRELQQASDWMLAAIASFQAQATAKT